MYCRVCRLECDEHNSRKTTEDWQSKILISIGLEVSINSSVCQGCIDHIQQNSALRESAASFATPKTRKKRTCGRRNPKKPRQIEPTPSASSSAYNLLPSKSHSPQSENQSYASDNHSLPSESYTTPYNYSLNGLEEQEAEGTDRNAEPLSSEQAMIDTSNDASSHHSSAKFRENRSRRNNRKCATFQTINASSSALENTARKIHVR